MSSFQRGRVRRAATGGFTTVAALALMASAAFACTMIMGVTKINNRDNGTWVMIDKEFRVTGPGLTAARQDVLKVRAWELPAKSDYTLWFVWPASVSSGVGCHTVDATTGVIMRNPSGNPLALMKANKQGMLDSNSTLADSQPYKAVVPNDAMAVSGGTAQICGRENPPFNGQWEAATQHVNLTIL